MNSRSSPSEVTRTNELYVLEHAVSSQANSLIALSDGNDPNDNK